MAVPEAPLGVRFSATFGAGNPVSAEWRLRDDAVGPCYTVNGLPGVRVLGWEGAPW
jgi:hypothetical protein